MLQPGQIFAGRYCIRQLSGSGAMADVYEARHVLTEHAVTLKVLRPTTPGAGARNFALEARIDARLNSPHIVRVQDAGIDEASGALYLVLEPLQGKTLARLLQEQPEGRLPVAQTLDVLRQVALGLDAAHAYGVVHRNLEPENIFITEQSLVKIQDFGLAKVLDSSGQVTQQLRGTPYYMAVEQAHCQAVSPQTDVWALGLVAYRALTGRIYWRCANRRGREHAALGEVVCEIVEPRRDLPSARMRADGLQLRLPEAFDEWLLRCLQVEPSRRFGSAGEAVAALQRALGAGESAALHGSVEQTIVSPELPVPGSPRAAAVPVRAGESTLAPRTPRPTRALRKWGALWVAAAVALLLASVFYPLRKAAPPAPPGLELPEVTAQGLTPAPGERTAAGTGTPSSEPAGDVPTSGAATGSEPFAPPGSPPAVAAVAAPAAVLAPQATPKISPIRAEALADEPRARPAPRAKKRARAAARRARQAPRRARAAESRSTAARESQEAGLARKLGLGAPEAAPPRPPPTELAE